ncbi:hypothetical protein [Candidatus Finniella inopinata]|uniref:Uncharacterized protein n=1 Tax=Candidatus Finniella inopinata TaxID=1696036 RepID=A0A4Q7DL32_9PROT|nr:hypothetical protein [Candidatus Finniella inopinata]RZI47118.1 hypothetical protein EQU50_00615 [Candidatus Finniella inopinata]
MFFYRLLKYSKDYIEQAQEILREKISVKSDEKVKKWAKPLDCDLVETLAKQSIQNSLAFTETAAR